MRKLLRDSPAGAVTGVVAQLGKKAETFPAELVIACDGRFSAVRTAAGIAAGQRAVPRDVIWFTVPRPAHWPDAIMLQGAGTDACVFLPNRGGRLQIGVLIRKGLFQHMRRQPLGELRDRIAAMQPALAPVLADHLTDWKQTVLLHAASAMAARWWQPGLLLLGDAAHVMSPVAGQGINTALQDALAAARHLGRWLAGDTDRDTALAAIEAERRPLVDSIQRLQDRAMRMLTQRGPVPDLLARALPPLLAAAGIARRVQITFAYGCPKLPEKAGSAS